MSCNWRGPWRRGGHGGCGTTARRAAAGAPPAPGCGCRSSAACPGLAAARPRRRKSALRARKCAGRSLRVCARRPHLDLLLARLVHKLLVVRNNRLCQRLADGVHLRGGEAAAGHGGREWTGAQRSGGAPPAGCPGALPPLLPPSLAARRTWLDLPPPLTRSRMSTLARRSRPRSSSGSISLMRRTCAGGGAGARRRERWPLGGRGSPGHPLARRERGAAGRANTARRQQRSSGR